MISFDEAYEIVIKSAFRTGTEIIPFDKSYERILAEEIKSDIYMPPFKRAAVDGYACRRSDLGSALEVIEVIAAGKEPMKKVGKNQCSKIMTGAMVPDSCDIVFMIEDSENVESGKIRFTGKDPKKNFSEKGDDVKKGDVILRPGKSIKPEDIAVLAALGHTNVAVQKMPEVGIISTGDELVEPEVNPAGSQIRNSNAYQLMSQVSRAGGIGRYYGIAPDIKEVTFKMIQKAIAENDIVILTGGVSMGDFDFVPALLMKAGVKIMFDKINVQPGKPTIFGIHPKALAFGLPGNPVSSFIQFETLIRPLINMMMGYDWKPVETELPLAVSYKRNSSGRMGWIPVVIDRNKGVTPVIIHGSAHITAIPYSDGIIAIKSGIKSLEKGEIVSVRQI